MINYYTFNSFVLTLPPKNKDKNRRGMQQLKTGMLMQTKGESTSQNIIKLWLFVILCFLFFTRYSNKHAIQDESGMDIAICSLNFAICTSSYRLVKFYYNTVFIHGFGFIVLEFNFECLYLFNFRNIKVYFIIFQN